MFSRFFDRVTGKTAQREREDAVAMALAYGHSVRIRSSTDLRVARSMGATISESSRNNQTNQRDFELDRCRREAEQKVIDLRKTFSTSLKIEIEPINADDMIGYRVMLYPIGASAITMGIYTIPVMSAASRYRLK